MSPRSLLLPLLILAGCPKAEPTESTNQVIESVCLDDGSFHVKFEGCLSSSCDTLKSAECTVTVTGPNADITGIAKIESLGDECTDDCGYIEAHCEIPDGITTVTINGEDRAELSEVADCGAI